jgi:hypothetical protein
MTRRRDGSASNTVCCWWRDRLDQEAISPGERPQPTQKPVTESTTQTWMQGVSVMVRSARSLFGVPVPARL